MTFTYLAVWLPTVGCRVGIASSVAVFVLLGFLFFYLRVLPPEPFSMDPQDDAENQKLGKPLNREQRTFEPLLERFIDIAKTIVGLSVASLTIFSAFVGYAGAKLHETSSCLQSNLYPVQLALSFPVVWQIFSIFFLVLFMALLTIWYEDYLHRPKSYSRGRYAFVLSCGLSGLACFVLGFFALGCSVLFTRTI